MSSRRTPHEPMRMNVGRCVSARTSATTISTLSVPMPVAMTEIAQAAMPAGDGVELAVATGDLDRVEQAGDAVGAVGVPGQEDVVRDLAGGEVDVVLAIGVGQRDQRVRMRHERSSLSSRDLATAAAVLPR